MIGTEITIKNHETGDVLVINDHTTDPANVIALQSYPSIEPDVRLQNQARTGAHGEFRLPVYYSGTSIVLQGVITCVDENNVWVLKRQLDEITQLSQKGYPDEYTGDDDFPPMFNNTLRISFTTPDGKNVFIDATPSSVSYDRPLKQDYLLNFQLLLRANTPYFIVLDDTPNTENGSIGSINSGLKLTTDIPFTLGEEYVENSITVTMETAGYAVVQLNGSSDGIIVNPRITNLTNGNTLKIRKSLSNVNQYFKIDGIYQTMEDQNGQSVQPYSDGDFIYLDKGDNVLVYSADALIPN